MNSIPLLDAAAVLRRHKLRPNPRLGQNFLQDPDALESIAAAADLKRDDTVLEIGCGLGQLTRFLASSAGRVLAMEIDPKLAAIAATMLKGSANVEVMAGDILARTPSELELPPNYVVAANIPYNITSAIIRHLLEDRVKPRRIVLTIQEEVARRICATPPHMSILALSVQVYGAPGILSRIPASCFFPEPKVGSAVLRIEIYAEPRISRELLPVFFKLIKAGFGQKRKTLRNNLSAALRISGAAAQTLIQTADIDPNLRAEALSFDEWNRLCRLPGLVAALGEAR